MQMTASTFNRSRFGGQVIEIGLTILIVVRELAERGNIKPAGCERVPESGRIAESAERQHTPPAKAFQRLARCGRLACLSFTPIRDKFHRRMDDFDPIRRWRQFCNPIAESNLALPLKSDRPAIGRRHVPRASPSTGSRSVPRGKDVLKTKRLQCVQKNDIEVAGDAAVLKCVVQHQCLASELVDRLSCRSKPIGVLHVRHTRQFPGELQGFVVHAAAGTISAADDADFLLLFELTVGRSIRPSASCPCRPRLDCRR